MNSQTLKERGFAEFSLLKELTVKSLPNSNQVFVLIDNTLSGKPATDILYIGRAKKPVKKIFAGFIGGSGGKTAKRINNALFNKSYIEKTSISWITNANPKITQKELLEKFMAEHGKYPLWNAQKKKTEKPKAKQKPVRPRRTRKPPPKPTQAPQ